MVNFAFIGAQTGDEGKGVRVVYYSKKAVKLADKLYGSSESPRVLTMRWNGGADAGHTVEMDGTRYALHQIPSSILIPGTYNLMGEGVFLGPRGAAREIAELREKGVRIDTDNFGIASNAHVTLEYHLDIDAPDASAKTGHLSTGKGIKPTAVDKFGRVGIRFEEFLDRSEFIAALKHRFPDGMPSKFESYEKFADSYAPERDALRDFSVLQSDVLNRPEILFGFPEGAQGFQIDVDRGLYHGVTSSNPSIVPVRTKMNIGVVKAYESSIGGGRPFVGRMEERLETPLREAWKEFGTTTKKPRNIGWLDVVALNNAIRSSDIDCLVSTCGDRLEELARRGENVRIITAYEIEGKRFEKWDKSFHKRSTLHKAKPVFEEIEPWDKFFDSERQELTPKARAFVERVQELTGKEFIAHGYGPGVDDVLEVKDILG
ncbi:MAG: adenylosuccinate synthetase [Candidatus Pacearchaeota archaeon]